MKNFFNYIKSKLESESAKEWRDTIIFAFVIAMLVRTFAFQPFKIPTGSMRMTLIERDRIFVNKLRYGPKIPFTNLRIKGFTKPKRGDVIVFLYPQNIKKYYIKRLIGLGGEKVEIKEGDIYINDKLVEDPLIKNIYYYNRGLYGEKNQLIQVPDDSYFVLGDNSSSSADSRFWGFVSEKYVIGRAEFIYWPLNRIRIIK